MGLGKVEKAYIDNPTLLTALGGERANIGNLRETFFYNQMRVHHPLTASRQADFRIGDVSPLRLGDTTNRSGRYAAPRKATS